MSANKQALTVADIVAIIKPDLVILCDSELLTEARRKALSRVVSHLTPPNLLALLDELEAAEKRIAELEVSHSKLRETMAALHNTIRGNGGAYTSLPMIMSVTKRAYEESAAAGITVKGE